MRIEEFWTTVDVVKCRKYIGYLHVWKVVPKVIEGGGGATGYWSVASTIIISIVTYLFA